MQTPLSPPGASLQLQVTQTLYPGGAWQIQILPQVRPPRLQWHATTAALGCSMWRRESQACSTSPACHTSKAACCRWPGTPGVAWRWWAPPGAPCMPGTSLPSGRFCASTQVSPPLFTPPPPSQGTKTHHTLHTKGRWLQQDVICGGKETAETGDETKLRQDVFQECSGSVPPRAIRCSRRFHRYIWLRGLRIRL
jgi:hypothetical protein